MTARRKLLLILVASLLLAPIVVAIVVVIAFVARGGIFQCWVSTILESTSPEGAYTAILVESDCGATTPTSRRVVIKSAEHNESVVLSYQGKLNLTFRWLSTKQPDGGIRTPTRLLVINHGNERLNPTRLFAKKNRYEGLSIEYRGFFWEGDPSAS